MSGLKEEKLSQIVYGNLYGQSYRPGPIFQRCQICRSAYRHQLRRNEKDCTNFYSNTLYESLFDKDTHTLLAVQI
jgi:hypothetical protein